MATVMSDNQLEFDLGADEKATNVTFEPVEPEENSNTPPVVEETPASPQASHKEELDAVADNVQKRIAKLTARMREAERREQAAIEYAKGLQNQAQHLQQKLVQTDYSRLNEAKVRLDTQQTALRQIIKKAREEGDIDTETEAQERLATLVQEQRQVASWLQEQAGGYQQQVQQQYAPQPQPQAQPQPQPQQVQPRKPDPRAEEWAAENEWFGQDRPMTYAAWGIHQQLIEEEGIDPTSDEYYTELDRRIRDQFPKRFADDNKSSNQSTRQQRSAPAVAPASRGSGVNSVRRTVRLSPSQVAIAKKLGVPLEEYAKYVKE